MKIIVLSNLAKDIYNKSFDKKEIESSNNFEKYIDLVKSNLNNSRFDFKLLEKEGFIIEEIYTNNKDYIKYLCLKNNLNQSKDFFQNIIEFINFYKPNIIIYRDIDVLNTNQIKEINFKLKFKIVSVLLSGFPPRNIDYFRMFSHIIFRNPCMISEFRKFCNSSSLIYHCFNSNILTNLKIKNFDEREKDFSFDGSSYSDGYYKHKKRYYYLNNILQKKLISCHLHERNNFYHYLTFINFFF